MLFISGPSCSKQCELFKLVNDKLVNKFVINELEKQQCFEQLGPDIKKKWLTVVAKVFQKHW